MQIWRSRRRPGRPGPHGGRHRQLRRRPPRPPARRSPGPARSPTSAGLRRRGGHLRPAPDGGAAPRARADHADLDRGRAPSCCGEAGADAVLALPFDREVAGWSPEEFVDRVLVDALHAAAVVVGANFRFGHRAAGDVATLPRAGRSRRLRRRGDRRSTAARRSGRRPTSAPAWPPATSPGAAEALGRPFTVRGVVVRGDQRGRELGFPTANVPDQRDGRGSRRRRVRRVAAAARHRRALPGRDQRRHQPDLRRRARAARRELRARPRPTSSSTASRSRSSFVERLRGMVALRVGRGARGADERRRRPGPRRCCWGRPREPGAVADARAAAEEWFLAARPALLRRRASGPPPRSALRPRRSCRCCSSAAAGRRRRRCAGVGGRPGELRARRRCSSLVAAGGRWYALTALHARPIVGWALRRTFGSLGLLLPLATRALPLLLLFVTFLFINTEVWQVTSNLDGGRAVADRRCCSCCSASRSCWCGCPRSSTGSTTTSTSAPARRLPPARRWRRRAASCCRGPRRRPGGDAEVTGLRALEPDPRAARSSRPCRCCCCARGLRVLRALRRRWS